MRNFLGKQSFLTVKILIILVNFGCSSEKSYELKTGASYQTSCNGKVFNAVCGQTVFKYNTATYKGSDSSGYVDGCYFPYQEDAKNWVRAECNKGSAFSWTCRPESTWQLTSTRYTNCSNPSQPTTPTTPPWHPRDGEGSLWMNKQGTIFKRIGRTDSYCSFASTQHFDTVGHSKEGLELARKRIGDYELSGFTFEGLCPVFGGNVAKTFSIQGKPDVYERRQDNIGWKYCKVPSVDFVKHPIVTYDFDVLGTSSLSLPYMGTCNPNPGVYRDSRGSIFYFNSPNYCTYPDMTVYTNAFNSPPYTQITSIPSGAIDNGDCNLPEGVYRLPNETIFYASPFGHYCVYSLDVYIKVGSPSFKAINVIPNRMINDGQCSG